MVTQYSGWVGGGVKGRIRCDHTVTYTADRTQAIYDGKLYLEVDNYISDSVNSWAVGGNDGAHSGVNLPVVFGAGGGLKLVWAFNFQLYGDGAVGLSVSGLEAVGVTVGGTFALDGGNLAPYLTNTNYAPIDVDVTASSFVISGIAANGNGTALNNVQMEVNTSASDVGASYFGPGTYSDATATGLTPNTTYYYRIRVHNAGGYWSAWGPWKTVKTGSAAPHAPDESWSISRIRQTSFETTKPTVSDDGGLAVDKFRIRVNTSMTESQVGVIDTEFNPGDPAPFLVQGLAPLTTYYARIQARNPNGYGPPTAWKSFTTLEGAWVNVAGVWKPAIIYVNVGGVWKIATRYNNVDGTWKQ